MQIVKNCLGQGDQKLSGNAIKLLTNALKSKNADIKNFVEEFFSEEKIDLDNKNEVFTGKIEGWLGSNDFQLIANTIALLTEMLKNKNTQTDAEGFIKNYSGKIEGCLVSKNDQLKANTIALLTDMFKSENTDLANIAKKIITDSTDKDVVIEGQGFAAIIKSCLGSGNDGLKARVVELLNEMLVGSDEELKNKSREILKSDVLNTKGILNIFLNDRGIANEEAISLLSPMCKDEEIKNTLSGLIGEDLAEKLEKQGNKVKSDDVVNMFYENVIVKRIFSEGNEKYIINLLENEDGLCNVDINFDENGQITAIEKTKLNSFFKDGKLNLEALKAQAITDISRDLRLIEVGKNTTYVEGKIDNGKGGVKKEQSLNKFFEDAKVSKDAQDLIYKFPGQSAISTLGILFTLCTCHLGDHILNFYDGNLSQEVSPKRYNIKVNDDGSVEFQVRNIGITNIKDFKLPMAIEEVHTFKINKGEDIYKTTNAKITVYRLKSTDIKLTELTEENLKNQKMLSQVSYNRDKDNNKKE